MHMSDAVKILIGAIIIWFAWQFVAPQWDKYWFTKEIERIATYATKKNDEAAVRSMLTSAFADYGVQKTGQDCFYSRDESRVVTIKCSYDAPVVLFGKMMHIYRMKIEVLKREEINKYFN